MAELRTTPLHRLHGELGARLVPFAGWEMPVQYPPGVMKEHLHCRAEAGLFDVSHMAQVILRPVSGDVDAACLALETLVPASILDLKEARQRYALFTDAEGGILDDLMVARKADHLFLVVNAARREHDLAHLRAGLDGKCEVEEITDRALVALQGPAAEAALDGLAPGAAQLRFMDVAELDSDFGNLWVSRSGYTGEDGYEVSVPAAQSEGFARALLERPGVAPIGLGARDSLRLEAGLCLYGQDIDATTTPVEAALEWSIQKARRNGGARQGGFPGAEVILRQLSAGAARRRVGLLPEGRAPVRSGADIFAESDADPVGQITSGAFGPSIGRPMSMGYVPSELSAPGTRLSAEVRDRRLPLSVVEMPFQKAAYKR